MGRRPALTYDTIYWLIMGASFVLTGVAGIWAMYKTGKLGLSFLIGSFFNIVILVGACIWWARVFAAPEQQFSLMFGIFGFGIALVNNEVLLFFAQWMMKRRNEAPQTP
jgi:hypothetical protein